MGVKKSFAKGRENAWGNLNYYVALEPKHFDKEQLNPVDDFLDALPHLRRKLANLRKCERAAQPATVGKAFVDYSDAQVAYRHALQIEAFNLGVELGTIVGRTGPRKASKAPGAAPVRGAILGAALGAKHASAGRLISLFAIADALLGGPADVRALKQAIDNFAAHRSKPMKRRPI